MVYLYCKHVLYIQYYNYIDKAYYLRILIDTASQSGNLGQ